MLLYTWCAFIRNFIRWLALIRISSAMASVQLVKGGRELCVRAALPASARALPHIQKRSITELTRGGGGRSSFSGIVATVFGATGFYGRYITNRLGRVGSQIVVPFRGDEHDYRHLRPMGDLGQLTFRNYHLKDLASVSKMVQYSNVVINLVSRDYQTRNFSFNDVNVDGARAIAEASKQAGADRLIHVSALGASPDSPSAFLRTKAKGEEVVREVFPEATIVRPAATYGHEDRFFNYYASLRVFPLGLIPMLKKGIDVYKQPVFVVDVAKAIMNIIADPTSAGKTFEFVGPRQYELVDLVQYLYRVMHRPCSPVAPPKPFFRLASWMLELSPFPPYMTRDILTRLHLTETLTGGLPGLEDVGVTPSAVEDTALTILRRYRDFLHFNKPMDEIQPVPK